MTTVQNRGGIPQTITREIEYTTTKSDSFSASGAVAIDVSVQVTMQIPFTPVHVGVEGTVAAEMSTEMGQTTASYSSKFYVRFKLVFRFNKMGPVHKHHRRG